MNKKTTNETNNTAKREPSPEEVKIQLTVDKINKILDEEGMTIQATLEGYPYSIRPAVKVVPRPNNATTNDKQETTETVTSA